MDRAIAVMISTGGLRPQRAQNARAVQDWLRAPWESRSCLHYPQRGHVVVSINGGTQNGWSISRANPIEVNPFFRTPHV